MSSHEDIQLDLAGYVTARLEAGARRRVDEHLLGCGECREMARSFRELAVATRESGDVLFEPHPPEFALRRYARAGDTAGGEGVARDLAGCAPRALAGGGWGGGRGGLRRPCPTRLPLF